MRIWILFKSLILASYPYTTSLGEHIQPNCSQMGTQVQASHSFSFVAQGYHPFC